MKRLFLLVALGLVAVACGGGEADDDVASLEDTTVTTESTIDVDLDNEEALLEFSQCMRDNGVSNFPDPSTDPDGNIRPFGRGQIGDLGADQSTIEAAQEECIPLVEDLALNFLRDNRSDIEDRLFEFASCMRDEGIDMPDPNFDDLFSGQPGEGGPFGGMDLEDPEVQEAAETCAEVFGANGGFAIPGRRGGDNG